MPLTYTRGSTAYAIRGLAGRSLISAAQPGSTAAILQYTDRDYLILALELDAHGLGEPQIGDRITEVIGGMPATFQVSRHPNNRLAWQWSDPDRLTYRVYTVPV